MSKGEENIVKSIIYGNIITTSYGMIRALCSAIGSKDHIDKIILYLRNNHNFLKYNKYIYAFRLQHIDSDLFITQNYIGRQKFLQGYNDDTGLQGTGEKLLALLQKFNVRNVLVILAIRQRDPLRELHAEHFVQMVKSAKDLLSSLYDKVVYSRTQQTINDSQDEIFKQPIQLTQYKIPLQEYIKTEKIPSNPNYVGKEFVKKIKNQTLQSRYEHQIKFLNAKIKELASILEQIIQKFGEVEDSQVKFAIKYDQNKKVVKVFNMLAELFDFQSKQAFLQENMSNHLKSITSKNLTSKTIRRLNQMMMSDKSLKAEILIQQNKICGILMQFLQVLLKSYSFARKLALIESQIQDQKNQSVKQQKSDTNTKKETSSIMSSFK